MQSKSGADRDRMARPRELFARAGSFLYVGFFLPVAYAPSTGNSGTVFALASHYERLRVAALEAIGAGLPVFATGVDGIRELVHPSVDGELVARGDAAAMADPLCDPERARRMGVAAAEFARTQRMEECVNAYIDPY